MKSLLTVLFVVLMSIAAMAQDRVLIGADYQRATIKPNFADPLKDVNAVGIHGLVKVAGPKGDGLRLRVGAEVQKSFNVEVFSDYMTPMGMVDIYRDPYTYSGLAELAYRFKFLELAARGKFGAEKLHESLDYQFTRSYEFRGSIVKGHFGFTPFGVGFKKQAQGFNQYFLAGAHLRF